MRLTERETQTLIEKLGKRKDGFIRLAGKW